MGQLTGQALEAIRLVVRAPDGEYNVLVGPGLLRGLGTALVERGLRGPVALVTDTEVGPRHAQVALGSLADGGLTAHLVTLPAGEAAKTLDTVRLAYDALLEARLGRDTTIVALGGGVIGDMVGFVAATYLRGVAFVQAPTTLLSMVDASVGGKVAVDMPQGKNLIGAFKTPRLVLADLDTLATLPPAESASGMAEVIKAGVIDDPDLFEHLERGSAEPLAWTITRAIEVKQRVVEADPYEQGRRAVLNLGHTFGHAIEHVSQYRLRHGECVAVGMVAAARLAASLCYASPDLETRLRACLNRFSLPIAAPGFAVDQVYDAMFQDKKKAGGKLRFILPRALGDVVIVGDIPAEAVKAALQAVIGDPS
ncbi:MAG: 3-dehydroquinate synthase [Anaerolineae bacterium]|nr:3-dehydroquinate synthase [Anaerolineae bacterium]